MVTGANVHIYAEDMEKSLSLDLSDMNKQDWNKLNKFFTNLVESYMLEGINEVRPDLYEKYLGS